MGGITAVEPLRGMGGVAGDEDARELAFFCSPGLVICA
jgi:hypothetical protein